MSATRNGLALAALLALAGCDDRIGDYPALMPTDQLLAEPDVPAHAADAAYQPEPTTDALKGRARALSGRAPAPGQSASDLSARADALRARAAELSRTSLDACPAGAEACDTPAAEGSNNTTPDSD